MSRTMYERYQQAKVDHPGKYALVIWQVSLV